MTDAEFRECVSSRPGQAANAAWWVLCEGKTAKEAAEMHGITAQAVHNEVCRVRANHRRLLAVFGQRAMRDYVEVLRERARMVEGFTGTKGVAHGVLMQFIDDIEGALK